MTNAKMPTTCQCGSLDAVIIDGAFVCAECKTKRGAVSALVQNFLDTITKEFGSPVEPIVCRRPNAARRIEQQDAQLKRKFNKEGKSYYDITTETIGAKGDEDDERQDDDNPDTGTTDDE
jgi:hypothetical protein